MQHPPVARRAAYCDSRTGTDRFIAQRRPAQALQHNTRFHRLTERLHRLGPRPVGQLLLEVAAGGDLIEALERYAELEPLVRAMPEARTWPPVPVGLVA